MALDKNELRAKIKKQRSVLDQQLWQEWSTQINKRVIESKFYSQAQSLHCYVSMNERKEVDTHSIINHSLDTGKTVFIPVMDTASNKLFHTEITDFNDLRANDWGVLEPINAVLKDQFFGDVIIIPLLAADTKGNRLGYGKGYYDRFLATSEALKVGIVFDQFLVDRVPVEDHDIPLDIIITETQTINV
ncbi:MAG: 5-formyltetrahydrofolate cyclo-ligase [Balneolaceae bacterium]|nr:5-formyltetrahydrofolate cyclo-ligase [Balneolaceae bacterium]